MTDDERRNGHRRSEDAMIDDRLKALEDGQERIFDEFLGPIMTRLDGSQYRDYKKGIAYIVRDVAKQLNNGGVKTKLPKTVWAMILAAVISGMFQVWTALIDTADALIG